MMLELKNLKREEGQIIEDKKNAFVKMVFSANKDAEMKMNMYDPLIWKGYPLSERFWYSFCCKTSLCSDMNQGQFFIDELVSNPCTMDTKLNLTNACVILKIIKTGTLEIEPLIIHPFVRISFVNLKTCKYLQKADFSVPSILLNEKNLIINHNKTQNILEYRESHLDFLPPLSTPPYDLREKGESYAEWNEEFIIHDNASNIYQSSTVILFELLDFNFKFLSKDDNSKESNIIPIAWGYLKPVGFSQTYFGKFKIQLYKYKYQRTPLMDQMRKTNNAYLRIPEVLYEFNWINKEKYQTFLEVEMRAELKPSLEEMNNAFVFNRFRNSVFAPEGELFDRDLLKLKADKEKKKLKYEEFDHSAHQKRQVLLRRRKGPSEDCILPDQLLFKFSTAKLGCLTHEFSNDGKYLAAACTDLSSQTTIKIFNVEEGVLKFHFKGHQQLIHSLNWTRDNQILITASSDNYVSFWQIPKDDSNNIENLDYMDNEKLFKLTSIPHPSYVYSTAIFPDANKDLLILATACFDGIVRIFSVNFSYDEVSQKYTYIRNSVLKQISVFLEFEKLDFSKSIGNNNSKGLKLDSEKASLLDKTVLDHRHPNCLVFDDIGRLYIGDSLGSIHVWEVSINLGKSFINKLQVITHKELEGDNINKIWIEPSEKKRLVVHSRDNCIRLLDVSKDKARVIVRYFGLRSSKTNIKSSISPDGQFILAGSEEGQPYLWSLISGIQIPAESYECHFLDPLADVSWNKQYNMFALSGFGQEYPLLVYVHEKNEVTVDPLEFKIKDKDGLLGGNEKIDVNLNHLKDNISDFAKEYKTLLDPKLK